MNKILLIEDDIMTREFLCELLQSASFDVIQAGDGRRGLQLARDGHPDLILCDINLPQIDGYGVLKALRDDLKMAQTPFIFVTSESCTPSCRRAIQLGANDFLSKPVDIQVLLKAITLQLNKLSLG